MASTLEASAGMSEAPFGKVPLAEMWYPRKVISAWPKMHFEAFEFYTVFSVPMEESAEVLFVVLEHGKRRYIIHRCVPSRSQGHEELHR